MNESSLKPNEISSERAIVSWLLLPLSLFPLVALLTYDWHAIEALNLPAATSSNWVGALGDTFAYYGYRLFGLAVWTIPVICIFNSTARVLGHRVRLTISKLWLVLFILSAAALLQVLQPHAPGLTWALNKVNVPDAGGAFGYLLMTCFLTPLLSDFGASVVMIIVMIASLIAAIGFKNIASTIKALISWTSGNPYIGEPDATSDESDAEYAARQAQYLAALQAKDIAKQQAKAEKLRIKEEKARAREEERARLRAERAQAENTPAPENANSANEESTAPVGDKGPYILPPLSLLNPVPRTAADHGDVGEMSKKLIDTLKLFGVDAELSYTIQGPVVTKYAIELAPGTKYSTVTNISDNLMGALHAKSLRIEAPIPGESAVGIEVPNRAPAGISFREIIDSDAWKHSKAELPLLFGKDAAGKELIADLASMPHMLVAGATGQGKSVCLNAIINGLLMTRTPEQLKLIMVDPKSVEFTSYLSIPHLLVPVITDNRKVVYSLHWAVAEMEKRLKLFARARVRNIYDFNHRKTFTQTDMFGSDEPINPDMPKTVPYIVIIIDEVADLMASSAKEVVPDISRIAAKARAAGIHLILATQRPDAKVITGTIKANIPGRVAFKTATSIDSRTILDDTGAESLIGRGDMLFKSKDGLLIRAQGAWISDPEIANITSFIEQHADTQFDEKFATKLGRVKEASIDDPFASNEDDPDNMPGSDNSAAESREQVKAEENASDFKKAVECIINTNRASTSHFQRRLGWGYNHAAKIMDMLEEAGIIGPQSGAGPRQIIMDQQQLLAIFQGDNNGSVATEETATLNQETMDTEELI